MSDTAHDFPRMEGPLAGLVIARLTIRSSLKREMVHLSWPKHQRQVAQSHASFRRLWALCNIWLI